MEKKRNWQDCLKLFGCGSAMGAADVVPGVSGGTMAFIMGIYDELLQVIRDWAQFSTLKYIFTFQFKKLIEERPWKFPISLICGIGMAILLLSSPIKYLLDNKPIMIWSFFFGLVAASVITVLHKVHIWNKQTYIICIAGVIGAYWLVGMVPAKTPEHLIFIVICGALAITAMILPGISGSFILLLLGKYDYIIGAIHNLKAAAVAGNLAEIWSNGVVLFCFATGIIIGLVSFVRLLNYLMKNHNDLTVALLIGFMIGSLRKVWPFKSNDLTNILPKSFSPEIAWAILLAAIGFITVMAIDYFSKKTATNEVKNEKV